MAFFFLFSSKFKCLILTCWSTFTSVNSFLHYPPMHIDYLLTLMTVGLSPCFIWNKASEIVINLVLWFVQLSHVLICALLPKKFNFQSFSFLDNITFNAIMLVTLTSVTQHCILDSLNPEPHLYQHHYFCVGFLLNMTLNVVIKWKMNTCSFAFRS